MIVGNQPPVHIGAKCADIRIRRSFLSEIHGWVYDHEVEEHVLLSLFDHDLAESVILDCPIAEN